MIIVPQNISFHEEQAMQIIDSPYQKISAGISILKSANGQPKLAGSLIEKTLEGMENQNALASAPAMETSDVTGEGKFINTTA
jgi:hypothetical protein